ncbi:hypothetical protein [Phyllobacterium sp. OV277]|uniref:hypothetical protein n=1 Tax=Phyllobacterium sp. OV277 TaxID=1882772 RepID=UPI00088EE88D|nr:hypothetical protein [Phyllobacterium sp. OV277]SDP08539.1 hypothetical protein SAMN05443582_103361 [Phyllobacterium sp. OV277]
MKLDRPYRHGEVIEDDPVRGFRRIWFDIDDDYGVVKTEYYATNELLDKNAAERAENQKWGEFGKVASIPLNILYRDLLPAIRSGDDAFIQRWLQNSDNAKWRTRDKI